jgi:L-ribulose-5-phosphate 4-epimerase
MTVTGEINTIVARLRQEVCDLHAQLTRYQLVIWTAGNVSARVPGHDLMVIKPSGVDYDALYAEYVKLHDWFGRGNAMMRTLREISATARAGATE